MIRRIGKGLAGFWGFVWGLGKDTQPKCFYSAQAFLVDKRSQGSAPGGLIQPKTLPSSCSISLHYFPRCQITVPRLDPNLCVPVELPGVGLSCKTGFLDWGGRCLRWGKKTAFPPPFQDARAGRVLASHKMMLLNPTFLKTINSVPLSGSDLGFGSSCPHWSSNWLLCPAGIVPSPP